MLSLWIFLKFIYFVHPFWIGKKDTPFCMWICGKHIQDLLKYATLDSFLNQSTKHFQPVFEGAWLKTLTDCTLKIMTVHMSSQPPWSFQQKLEKEKKSCFILCCLFKRTETLKIIDNMHKCCSEFMLTIYSGWKQNIQHLCEECMLVLRQWTDKQLDSVGQKVQYAAGGPNNISCSKCISLSLCCCWTKQTHKNWWPSPGLAVKLLGL